MYLRLTTRQNKNGTTACYAGLAENVWNPKTRRSETRVIHSFGRTDKLDQGALRRLVASINRVPDLTWPDWRSSGSMSTACL